LYWTNLGFVKSEGLDTGLGIYSFYDEKPHRESNYYRLQIKESDGRVQYSSVIHLQKPWKSEGRDFLVFPNPAMGRDITIVLPESIEQGHPVWLLDANGQIIRKIAVTETIFQMSVHPLSGGLYFICTLIGEDYVCKKIII
jgi:hypothetical protein